MTRNSCLLAIVCVSWFCSGTAAAQDRTTHEITKIDASPSTVTLDGRNRRQQVIVTGHTANGRLIDLTRRARFVLADEQCASWDMGVVVGLADGETTLTISHGRLRAVVAVRVAAFKQYPPVNFSNDIMPLFSKLSCNSGGCHGKASGQNGFKLSVFGFDQAGDYAALVKESRARRVFPGNASQSLLVLKATGEVAHGGGKRANVGSPDHELLLNWVQQGMPWGDAAAPHVADIEIQPAERILSSKSRQQLLITARFSDGSARDVTRAATYTSNAPTVAEVEAGGLLRTGTRPGEAAITVNYMGFVGVARVMVPRTLQDDFHAPAARGRVDELVWQKLKKIGVRPSGVCDDATFFRRLYIDAIGTLPTADEVRTFLADKSPDKREAAIDAVLDRPEYADFWAGRWADVLLVDRDKLGNRGAYETHQWLRQQLQRNRPYDEWVSEILTATGDSSKFGPVNFYRAARTPVELTRAVSQAFLGIRMDCAQCHHHPFDRWGQEDFYGLAGFFNGLQHKPIGSDRELVFHPGHRPTEIPIKKIAVTTQPPGGFGIAVDASTVTLDDSDPRIQLARWVTSPRNPWFARLAANRLWAHFLGKGLVEPVDDLRSTNPATNEPLLTFLAREIVTSGHDLKAVMRLILNSQVYQLSSVPNSTNADDNQNFSHYTAKRMSAAVLLDAISQVTGSPETFPGMPKGTRAIHVWDNQFPSYFLDTFGRSERKSPCECGTSSDPTMAQALHLMNAPEIEAKITSKGGRPQQLARSKRTKRQMIDEVCLAAWGRLPSEKERQVAEQLMAGQPLNRGIEDVMWATLNSYSFLFVQ